MTLVTRVSSFFLAALAVGLAGYSLIVYGLIRDHLYHQFDHRLTNALNVLIAAVEVESDGVKWQPSDHTITVGDEGGAEEVRWVIVNELGAVVDRSRNLQPATTDDARLMEAGRMQLAAESPAVVDSWRLLQKQLKCPEPKPVAERDADESATLTVTVGGNAAPLRADLWRLAALVTAAPIALWLVAAGLGRWYIRRALEPVQSMAARARGMEQADFQLRLPVEGNDELSDLARAFNGLLARLQSAFDRQQRFTGDAAHQLRTPLTVLRGEIDLALRRPRSDAEYRTALKTLSEQTEELQRMVESLLFLARAEGDAEPPPRETLVAADWLPEYLHRYANHPRSADIVLEIDPHVCLRVSPTLLSQALDNLLGNALKYSAAGTPIRVEADLEGAEVALSVEDQGIGIAAEDRSAIFEPFFRSPEARKRGIEGTGLGLALVARLAAVMGGRVTYAPGVASGSRFTLYLAAASVAKAVY